MERLVFGTRIVMEARGLDGGRFERPVLSEALEALARLWPLGGSVERLALEPDASEVHRGSRGYVILHAFPERGALVIEAFTEGHAPMADFVEAVEGRFDLTAYALQRTRYGNTLPAGEAALRQALKGLRFWANARMAAGPD
ncbi:MAG TPA: hypothetical protein ENK37_02910 [Oceanithermus profundus]|uniref:Uncharacterized protein n=1 Tax=Oceanithermus profundus TaxID=187137 RepID=A0A7C4Z4Q3_9DEIN|nr:hypothetical protein [Oceanithermus profundus]